MNLLVSLAFIASQGGGEGEVLPLREILADMPTVDGRELAAHPSLAESRLFLAGGWSSSQLRAAIASAARSEWKPVGRKLRLHPASSVIAVADKEAAARRYQAVADALEEMSKQVEPFQDPDVKRVAEAYAAAVEEYARRTEEGLLPPSEFGEAAMPGHHPMRTLVTRLLAAIGPRQVASVLPGESRLFTTLSIYGGKPLPDAWKLAKEFDEASRAVADRLGSEAAQGALSKVSGMKWLFGSPASWSPTKSLSLRVTAWHDQVWAALTLDCGFPMPDGYMETIRLDDRVSEREELPDGERLKGVALEFSPGTARRYGPPLRLARAGESAPVAVPESLAVADVLRAYSKATGKAIVALLPPGLEAQYSRRFKPKMPLAEALRLLGIGGLALESLEVEGLVVSRPRKASLGLVDPSSALAGTVFVAQARKRGDFGADDLGRYLAGLDTAHAGTAEPSWWEAALFREGVPVRSREANLEAYRLLGAMLALSGRGGRAVFKWPNLPAGIQALARDFAVTEILVRNGEMGSILTLESAAKWDWSKAEVVLERREVRAAKLVHTGFESLATAAELAAHLENWQPGSPETMDPERLRLEEGKVEVFEVAVEFPDGSSARRSLTGRFASGGEPVTGFSALSEGLRDAVERERARIRAEGG